MNISVYGVCVDEIGRVLLVEDSSSGLWGFPGGGVEDSETHFQALQRELHEETGLYISDDIKFITEQSDKVKVRFFYRVQVMNGSILAAGNGSDTSQSEYVKPVNLITMRTVSGIDRILDLL